LSGQAIIAATIASLSAAPKGPHAASLHCAGCGRHRGGLPAAALGFIEETRQRFGAPQIITIRQREAEAL
jgi:hypothetical protein